MSSFESEREKYLNKLCEYQPITNKMVEDITDEAEINKFLSPINEFELEIGKVVFDTMCVSNDITHSSKNGELINDPETEDIFFNQFIKMYENRYKEEDSTPKEMACFLYGSAVYQPNPQLFADKLFNKLGYVQGRKLDVLKFSIMLNKLDKKVKRNHKYPKSEEDLNKGKEALDILKNLYYKNRKDLHYNESYIDENAKKR